MFVKTAVGVNADASKFPENWLFNHRWGKGKRKKEGRSLKLASGQPATIKWIKVGGRTSAYVAELQHLSAKDKPDGDETEAEVSDLTSLSDLDGNDATVQTRRTRKKPEKEKETKGEKLPRRASKRQKVTEA